MADAATDLLVIGGGPAGLATAIAARLAGMSVRLVERSRPPIDKACGEGLMPDAVTRLAELGVELATGESCRFRGIRYLDSETVAEGVFPRAGGLGVRRLHLHQALVRRAAELGVDLRWGVAVHGLAPMAQSTHLLAGGAYTDRAGLEVMAARWVIGADGLHSRVRRWAGLEGATRRGGRHRRFGVRRHFACRPWSDMVEVYWGPGCEAYVTPVGPREVGVAMLWSDPRDAPAKARRTSKLAAGTSPRANAGRPPGPSDGSMFISDVLREVRPPGTGGSGPPVHSRTSFDSLLAHFPALGARLTSAPIASRDRGAGPLLQSPRAVWRGNVALVGDASGYVDAITGEGLAVALHQSAALIDALRAGDLARYGAAHRRIGRLPNQMTALLLAIERRPWLRHRMVRALAAEPALFSRLLGIHARALPARLGIDGALRLVYRLVTA